MDKKYYLISPYSQMKYPINGLLPSNVPVDAIPMSQLVQQQSDLPSAVSLREYMSNVEAQLKSNSCVANSIVGAYEYLLRRQDNNTTDMSRLFIYYNARALDPQRAMLMRDTGCMITHAIHAIKTFGTCSEDRWKFIGGNCNRRPTQDCYEEAKNFKATDAVELSVDLDSMRTCLARGYPFVIGAHLFQSFTQAETNGGYVSLPREGEPPLRNAERHAMLVVGYDDARQLFTVRNSWGPQWGHEGYCFMPYPYVANPKYVEQVYTIRRLNSFDFGQEHWVDPSQIQYGISTNLGAGEDGEQPDGQVVPADDDDEEEAGAPNNEEEEAGAADQGNGYEGDEGVEYGDDQGEEE